MLREATMTVRTQTTWTLLKMSKKETARLIRKKLLVKTNPRILQQLEVTLKEILSIRRAKTTPQP